MKTRGYSCDQLVVQESYANGATNADQLTLYGPGGVAADLFDGGIEGYHYLHDPQGSLAERLDINTGTNSSDAAVFDAFGALHGEYNAGYANGTVVPETNPDSVGFGGQYGYHTDTETGLVMMTHRYYDSGKGRFINRDPIGAAVGSW